MALAIANLVLFGSSFAWDPLAMALRLQNVNTTKAALLWQQMVVFACYFGIWIAVRRIRVATTMTLGLVAVPALANYVKLRELGLPLQFSDLIAPPTVSLIVPYLIANLPLLAFASLVVWAIGRLVWEPRMPLAGRSSSAQLHGALAIFCLTAGLSAALLIPVGNDALREFLKVRGLLSNWRPEQISENLGPILSISTGRTDFDLPKPPGYSSESMRHLVLESQATEELGARGLGAARKPDVVVVMLESFVDPLSLGITFNRDPIPNLRRLSGGSFQYATTPTLGGNTANVEFEFLTGIPVALLPQGMVPYSHALRGDVDSLARSFEVAGYRTYGMHNYLKYSWNRAVTYRRLGFDERRFLDDVKPTLWPTDDQVFSWADDVLQSRPEQAKFVFVVTVNSHGPYSFDRMREPSDLFASGGDMRILQDPSNLRFAIEVYARKLARLDDSVAAFLAGIDLSKTDVLLFGDHQPSLRLAVDRILAGDPEADPELVSPPASFEVPVVWLRNGKPETLVNAGERLGTHCLGIRMAAHVGVERRASLAYWESRCATNPSLHWRASPDRSSAAWAEMTSMAYYLLRDFVPDAGPEVLPSH